MGRPSRKRVKKAKPDADQEHPDECTTYNVIGICFEQARLRLDSLARVATISKQARTMVQLFLQQNTGLLLPGICNKASEVNRKIQEKPAEWNKLVLLVKWFCKTVGKEALQQDEVTLQALLVRKTPADVVQMLLDAGMRVTHQHLVSAAYQRAEGLESWVIKPYSDQLPPLTQALCGSNMKELRRFLPSMEPADIPDILVLAVDLLSPAAAQTVLCYLQTDQQQELTAIQTQLASTTLQQQRRETRRSVQKQLNLHHLAAKAEELACRIELTQEPLQSEALIQTLLALAVARRHVSVVQRLCLLDAAKKVPGTALADLIQRAVGHKSPQVFMLDDLMQLMAKSERQLPAHKVVALLQLAVQRRNSPAVHRLVHQDAAEDLKVATVHELLNRTVQLKDPGSAEQICLLPAAQQIPSQDILAMLNTAVRLRSSSLSRILCALPATAQIPETVYFNLMSTVVEHGLALVLFELIRCTAGQRMSATSAGELMATALNAGPLNDSVLAPLCDQLPAAAAVDRDRMRQLLMTAIRDSNSTIMQRLCTLHPAVGQLTAADVAAVMYTALEQRIPSCVPYICHIPAAHFIPVDELYKILDYGLSYNKAGGVLQIFNSLPVLVQQLEPGQVTKLLRAAMQVGIPAIHIVRALTGLPAAQNILPDELESLFRAAMRSYTASASSADTAQPLLQAAAGLPADTIKKLVLESFILDKGGVAVQLLKLPKAQEFNSEVVVELLLLLLEQTKTTGALMCSHRCQTCPESESFKALCALPQADNISADEFVNIVHAVMKLPTRLSCGTSAPQLWLDRLGQLKNTVGGLAVVATSEPSSPTPPAGAGAAAAAVASGGGGSHVANRSSSSSSGIGASSSSLGVSAQPASHMWQLMSIAVSRHPWSLKTLCAWEPVQGLSAWEVESLLSLAFTPAVYTPTQSQGITPMQLLTRLESCKKLESDALAGLLLSAVRQNKEEAVKYLSRIEPGAKGIPTGAVIELLHAAIHLPFGKAVHYICQLEGAKGMTAGDVAEVLKMNEEMGFAFDVTTLRSCLCKAVQQPCGGAHTIA